MIERRAKPTCPICDRTPRPEALPFCSKRCADVDLGRWLTGQYVIPGPPAEEDEDPPTRPEEDERPPRRR